jgi:hypothetical protein
VYSVCREKYEKAEEISSNRNESVAGKNRFNFGI